MDRAELEQDKAIDPEQLDVECVRQADLFFKWAERLVEAGAKLEREEFDLEVLEARLQLECREYPERFNVKNITETAIKSAVKSCPRYGDAYRAYLAAKGEKMLLEKAVGAMDMRKRMLEALIDLFGREYFAGPSEPRDLVGIWKRHHERPDSGRQRAAARRRGDD